METTLQTVIHIRNGLTITLLCMTTLTFVIHLSGFIAQMMTTSNGF